jgi:hypothetical protein
VRTNRPRYIRLDTDVSDIVYNFLDFVNKISQEIDTLDEFGKLGRDEVKYYMPKSILGKSYPEYQTGKVLASKSETRMGYDGYFDWYLIEVDGSYYQLEGEDLENGDIDVGDSIKLRTDEDENFIVSEHWDDDECTHLDEVAISSWWDRLTPELQQDINAEAVAVQQEIDELQAKLRGLLNK